MSGTHAAVILRSPTRHSRFGDGAPAGPKNLLPSIREKILRFAQDDNLN
jgi:hypothetical protein